MPKIPPELQPFIVPVCILAGLFLISIIRILFLLRTNRRLLAQQEKMEQQVLNQQRDVIHTRQDSHAWRGALQMQVDAFRAESSRRLEDAEVRNEQAVKQHEARIAGLEDLLKKALSPVISSPAAAPSESPPAGPGTATRIHSVLDEVVLPSFDEAGKH